MQIKEIVDFEEEFGGEELKMEIHRTNEVFVPRRPIPQSRRGGIFRSCRSLELCLLLDAPTMPPLKALGANGNRAGGLRSRPLFTHFVETGVFQIRRSHDRMDLNVGLKGQEQRLGQRGDL